MPAGGTGLVLRGLRKEPAAIGKWHLGLGDKDGEQDWNAPLPTALGDIGFDYSYIPDPTLPDNIEKDAGRGLYLMKTLSDDLIFEDGGSKVTMVFNL